MRVFYERPTAGTMKNVESVGVIGLPSRTTMVRCPNREASNLLRADVDGSTEIVLSMLHDMRVR